jgi:hypothetical protein
VTWSPKLEQWCCCRQSSNRLRSAVNQVLSPSTSQNQFRSRANIRMWPMYMYMYVTEGSCMRSQVKTGRPFQIGRGRRHGSSAVPVPGLPAVYDRGQQNRSVGTAKEGAEKQAEGGGGP